MGGGLWLIKLEFYTKKKSYSICVGLHCIHCRNALLTPLYCACFHPKHQRLRGNTSSRAESSCISHRSTCGCDPKLQLKSERGLEGWVRDDAVLTSLGWPSARLWCHAARRSSPAMRGSSAGGPRCTGGCGVGPHWTSHSCPGPEYRAWSKEKKLSVVGLRRNKWNWKHNCKSQWVELMTKQEENKWKSKQYKCIFFLCLSNAAQCKCKHGKSKVK